MNYCLDCGDQLVDPIEWRYRLCLWCLVIRMEKLDANLNKDYWFDDGECGTL